jgi:hypothetical protein
MNHFTPQSIIKSYTNAYPNEKITFSDKSMYKLVKQLVLFNDYYTKDAIENTLHHLVNLQYEKKEFDTKKMDYFHLYITQNMDEMYDESKQYPKCCLSLNMLFFKS